jgi:putative transposase
MRDSGAHRQKSAPYRYANQLPFQVENFILNVKQEHPSWGARKIRERLIRRFSGIPIPPRARSMRCWIATVWSSAARRCVVGSRDAVILGQRPNELWCTDYKGEFLLGNHNTATRSQLRPREPFSC